MQYLIENYENELESMRKMVQKLYPGFDEKKDYCLWMVLELFDDTLTEKKYFPRISLTGDPGQILNPLPDRARILSRKPYPNWNLRQIGVAIGAKRVFGVPFVFPDLSALKEVHSVHADWFCLYPVCPWQDNNSRVLAVHYDFILDWKNTTEDTGHWFTISHEEIASLQNHFHIAAGKADISGIEIDKVAGDKTLDNMVSDVSEILLEMRKNPGPIWKEKGLSMRLPVDIDFRSATIHTLMEPMPYADLLPDTCFGFEDCSK